VTAYEEPAVVELTELLDDQQEHVPARPVPQVALVIGLTLVGLVALSVLAYLLVPAVAEFVRWIVFAVRLANGA
jgi:hypothetical protein